MGDEPLHERIVASLSQYGVTTAERTLDSDVTDWVSTQAASLNYCIGQNGLPVGRMTTIVGLEASGKSTLGIHLLVETQQRGGVGILIDAERRYSRDRAERIGIDHSKLVYSNGETLEGTFEMILALVKTVRDEDADALVTIVWDSISGSPTENELKGEYQPGIHARVVSARMREIHPMIANRRITLVIVNQLRQRMEFGGGSFMRGGNKNTMIADRALSYWSSVKIACSNAGAIGEDKEKPTGMLMRASTKRYDGGKNTVARPERSCIVPLDFTFGFDIEGAMFEAAKDAELITANGAWWVNGDHNFQSGKWDKELADTDIAERIAAAPTDWQIAAAKKMEERAKK